MVTKKEFDNFIDLLKKFDKDYWKSSDRRVYTAGKKIADKIEVLVKNPGYKAAFELWEHNNEEGLILARRYLD